ncbi:MAG: helix-turn-helix transcriptional regulator [Clostridia bacterium]|nr:helix-turn-helix transcriptional regulator [Clostridia bacterium]
MKKKYYTESSNQYIYTVFYSPQKQKSGCFRNHHHTETELNFIIYGSGEYNLGGKNYTFRAGDLFIVRSNEQHCIPTITSDTLLSLNMYISPYFFWNECADYIPYQKIRALIDADIPILNRRCGEDITSVFTKIAKLYEDGREDLRFALRGEVLNAIRMIADGTDVDESADFLSHLCLEDVQKAMEFIKINYKNPISLEDIAKSAAMSSSYLSATFKKITGMSPYNYLITTRIEKAAELIKKTDKTVMSIALECGFTSLTSFNKAFKKLVGITPMELRQMYK